MGCPCDTLVPVAVLYDNPNGLSFDEFFSRVNEISRNVASGEIEDLSTNKYDFARYILNLPFRKEHKDFVRSKFDSELNYHKERFFCNIDRKFSVCKEKRELIKDEFVLETYLRNSFEKKGYQEREYVESDDQMHIPEKYNRGDFMFRALKVLESSVEGVDFDAFYFCEKVLVAPVLVKVEEEIFESDDEVTEKYPQYFLENIFDFSTERSFVYPTTRKEARLNPVHVFHWNKKGGKYFLDIPFMLDKLSLNSVYASDSRSHWSAYSHIDQTSEWRHPSNDGVYSLTDLVLTCEAIRKGHWKVLKWSGNRPYFLRFLYNNPDVFKKYENAVLDTEFSLFAKRKKWTHFEFLRNYQEMTANRTHLELEKTKKIIEEYREEEQKVEKARLEKIRKKLEKKSGEDILF